MIPASLPDARCRVGLFAGAIVERQRSNISTDRAWTEYQDQRQAKQARVDLNSPMRELWPKRLNGERPPLPQIDGTLFVADTKHVRGRICRSYRFSKPPHTFEQSARFARDAADQETDFHVFRSRGRSPPSPLVGSRRRTRVLYSNHQRATD